MASRIIVSQIWMELSGLWINPRGTLATETQILTWSPLKLVAYLPSRAHGTGQARTKERRHFGPSRRAHG
jgi:hypothetical protein